MKCSASSGQIVPRFFQGILIVSVLALSAQVRAAETYSVAHVITTEHGKLQILEDRRITPALEDAMWKGGCTDPLEIYAPNDPRGKPFISHPLLPARLRYVTSGRTTISNRVLDKQAPVARIRVGTFDQARDPIFLIETNDSACFGSYSGEAVMLMHFRSGDIGPVMARDANGSFTAISMFTSLKSAWRIVRSEPDYTEIEQIYCRPDYARDREKDDLPFLITYITYRRTGNEWVRATRAVPGFWESDSRFPPRSAFP